MRKYVLFFLLCMIPPLAFAGMTIDGREVVQGELITADQLGINNDAPNDAVDITGNIDISMGMTIGNNRWIAADDSAGTGFINMIKVNTSDAIDVGGTLNAGTIKLEEDSGLVTLVNQPVSSSVSDGTEQGYTFAVDSSEILRVSALSDGTGGVDTLRVTFNGNLEFSNNLTVAAAGTSNTTYISVFDTNGNKYTIAAVKDVT